MLKRVEIFQDINYEGQEIMVAGERKMKRQMLANDVSYWMNV